MAFASRNTPVSLPSFITASPPMFCGMASGVNSSTSSAFELSQIV